MSAQACGSSISPLDGRYSSQLGDLAALTSESALNLYRVRVEAHWLLFLADHQLLPSPVQALTPDVRAVLKALTHADDARITARIKEFERQTNHDVKAVEYFIREELERTGAPKALLAAVHFALTSEDVNNAAYALMLKDLRLKLLIPVMDQLLKQQAEMALRFADCAMLSRTHGQSASPTSLGKELAVFGHRLQRQREQLAGVTLEAKFSGAVGNYNAHKIAFPHVNWPEMTKRFLEERLQLQQNPWTTQIENHDSMVEYFDAMRRFATISIGYCRDVWSYISLGYLRLRTVANEVGSSTMPHKVNPIDFENAEGNFGIAVALLQHFSEKLPISRLQRDLSDSTVLRNIGVATGHLLLGIKACIKGGAKVDADSERMRHDLNHSAEVLTEAVQTVLRTRGVHDAYERLKTFSRGQPISREDIAEFVTGISELDAADRSRLIALEPADYIGEAPLLARQFASQWGVSLPHHSPGAKS